MAKSTRSSTTPETEATGGTGISARPTTRPLPFVDAHGEPRSISIDECVEVAMTKTVKIDGVRLEHNSTPFVPEDIRDRLAELGAIEEA